MKFTYTLVILLTLVCCQKYYSQENAKGLSLKVKYLETLKKNDKTSWLVKTTLINHSRDTLFYVSSKGCEVNLYLVGAMVDSIQLTPDFKDCRPLEPMVISVPPLGQRVVELEISSQRPVNSSFKLIVYLLSGRVKTRNEPFIYEEVIRKKETRLLVVSKKIKIPVSDAPLKPKG
ncbi:MAG: hypothetical protein SFY56_05815 [Bacteroidota bacterium]|nr:hypothetical protein [Bacteroidota bacterium]